jgi:hypothetical protein
MKNKFNDPYDEIFQEKKRSEQELEDFEIDDDADEVDEDSFDDVDLM